MREAAAQRLRVLGHPDRLRIVEALSLGSAHVGELAARLGMSVGRTSRHLGALHDALLVDRSQRGNHVLYVLADRDVSRLVAVAYRGAATQVRRTIALAPGGAIDDLLVVKSSRTGRSHGEAGEEGRSFSAER